MNFNISLQTREAASRATGGAVPGQRGGPMTRLVDRLFTWQERADQRRRLMRLDPRMLSDIGVGRAEALREYRKPFWRA